ncbi:MAG: HD domain-containing protein [Firmicutes bacterium]|nr:HD domain-containing protein [Bacillota bacterium]
MEDNFKGRRISLPTVPPDADLREVAGKLLESEKNVVIVGREGEDVQGYIDSKSIIKWLLMGDESAKVKARDVAVLIKDEDKIELSADIEEIVGRIGEHGDMPLFTSEGGNITGRISLPQILAEVTRIQSEEKQKRINIECFIDMLIDVIPFGIAVVSEEGEVQKANELARKIISENSIDDEEMRAIIKGDYRKIIKSKLGTYYKVEASFLRGANFVLIAFVDVSAEYALMERLQETQNEVETAFLVMLPDQRIEARLKSIVEYMDEYDESTGMIKITGIIEDGCYRHIVNMLKLLADALKQGLMELPGMEKNTLAQAIVLHDIGKVQPNLKVGDKVNPKEAFEKSFLHAYRGASLIKALYDDIDDKVYLLIKYHHHQETELPDDFPDYLLPMHRFFRLIDGLSAGITRRGSRVSMKVNGTRIYVKEESSFPPYNREIEIDVYTGSFVSLK